MARLKAEFLTSSSMILDAMANSRRLNILAVLLEREISVGLLSEEVGLSQSALSQHLSKLYSAGLVSRRREAQTVFYQCRSRSVSQILDLLSQFFESEPGD